MAIKTKPFMITLWVMALVAGSTIAWYVQSSNPLTDTVPWGLVTDLEKLAFVTRALPQAVKSNTIQLRSCYMNPTVAAVRDGELFFVENNDNQKHTVTLLGYQQVIGRHVTAEVRADFVNGPGLYTVLCDQSVAGFLEVLRRTQ